MGYFLYNGSWTVAVGDVLDFLLVAWQFLGTTVHSIRTYANVTHTILFSGLALPTYPFMWRHTFL